MNGGVYECIWTVEKCDKYVYKIYDSEAHSLKFLKTKKKHQKILIITILILKSSATMKIELWGRKFLNRKIQENV